MQKTNPKTFSVTKVFITTISIVAATSIIFAGMVVFFQDDSGTIEEFLGQESGKRGLQGRVTDPIVYPFDDDLNTNN